MNGKVCTPGLRGRLVWLAVMVALAPAAAAAQVACESYVAQEGDTLGSISMAAFGRLDYQLLFNANSDVLRSTSGALATGTTLQIPCEDGRLTETEVVAAPEAVEPVAVAASGGYKPTVRFVTGGDWYPFADEGLTGGGFLIRLVSTAMQRANNDHPFSVDWVDDWSSHETVLLPTGAFDMSVAWYQPDCDTLDQMSEATQNLCLNYLFSDSLYDAVFGFFAAKDSPFAEATTFEELKGARICRPEGYSFHDLDAQGLMAPAVTISVPPVTADCFNGLVDGTYDIATVESQLASAVIQELGIADKVVENPRLTSIQAIAAMAWKANPRALEYLTYLNRGLAEMRDSGEWNDIIASSLKEANDKLAAGGP
ncbi:MAG: transporter substrate-binding domain-containing protein [Rhodobacterales bacterium]|nr:transporter substrate-binding domain-containing protein [Rhodobacterales bacterium]